MSGIINLRNIFFRLALIAGVVFAPMVKVRASSPAQGGSAPAWVVRSINTSEYGVNDPKGLTFSSRADTFFVLDGTANIALITMLGDDAGTRTVSDAQADPANAAFDNASNSLLVFNRGKSELTKRNADGKGLPVSSAASTKFDLRALSVKDAHGIAFASSNDQLFILDAGNAQIVSLLPHPTLGFDGNEAVRSKKVQRISLKRLGAGPLNGLAYNPGNGHLYVADASQKKIYELAQDGSLASTFDFAALGIINPVALTFAPSVDNTDDPNKYNLFVLDNGQPSQAAKMGFLARAVSPQTSTSPTGQIVEVSLVAPASLPAGTTLLPTTLVGTVNASSWANPSPDTSGIDYWPAKGEFLIDDSEVEESVGGNPPAYWHGFNVFQSTLAGAQTGNCTTFTSDPVNVPPTYNNYSNEPTGIGINPNNNHLFISNDGANSRVFEVSFGPDGIYCTPDDVVTRFVVASLYGSTDAEDVAYGNNTLFISDGVNAEVYVIPLGANGVLDGGGDDGPVTHFDTASLGFNDLEGIGYNADAGTLFIVSTQGTDNYLGEVTTTGTLVHAYDLSFMGTMGNLRSDVTYAPSSQNPAVKNIYIVSRGVDNNTNRLANDGKIWEVNIGNSATGTPTNTPTNTSTSTPTFTPGPTSTPTNTPTATPTSIPSDNAFYASFANSTGTVGGVSFADEDVLRFDGTSWSLFFDGSDVGVAGTDLTAFALLDANTLLMSFSSAVTVNGVTVNPQDVVKFSATSLGSNTVGTFSMYFHGSNVGFDTTAEKIDALGLLPDGRILISTTGNPAVTGISGGRDEDILAFTPTTLGDTTSGTWAMYFDGSDVGLGDLSTEDIDALDVAGNGDIYLSALGAFAVPGVSGDGNDVFVCAPTSLGNVTACNYSSSLFFDGTAWGLGTNNLDAFELLSAGAPSTPTPTSTPTNTPTAGPSPTPTNTPTSTPTGATTSTPTPTNTPSASDLIFADGFESGDLSAWTSSTTDLGDLSVSPSAALVGSQGMQGLIDDTNTIYVTDDSPNSEPRYRARFYFDPNSITMASGNAHYIFKGFVGNSTEVLRVEFRNSSGLYQLRASLVDDATTWISTNWFTISDASHFVELDWQASTAAGANNGSLTLWIDGVQQGGVTGIDNDTRRVDRVRLGALSGIDTGTSGVYYFDAFESRRQTYIGP